MKIKKAAASLRFAPNGMGAADREVAGRGYTPCIETNYCPNHDSWDFRIFMIRKRRPRARFPANGRGAAGREVAGRGSTPRIETNYHLKHELNHLFPQLHTHSVLFEI